MKKYLFFVIMLPACCFAQTQTLSQTKTASRFNDFQGAYVDSFTNGGQGGAQYVASDDNLYAYTRKLNTHRSYASLVLQGFGFTIPDGATIENIVVSVRRFKSGRPSIRDYFATLVKSPDPSGGLWSDYGFWWQHLDNYPDVETETIYSQSGTRTMPDPLGNRFYQWTPAMINDRDFGVRIDVYPPVGGGAVVVYYDLVEITVEYSFP
jgi:hypothetical protein